MPARLVLPNAITPDEALQEQPITPEMGEVVDRINKILGEEFSEDTPIVCIKTSQIEPIGRKNLNPKQWTTIANHFRTCWDVVVDEFQWNFSRKK